MEQGGQRRMTRGNDRQGRKRRVVRGGRKGHLQVLLCNPEGGGALPSLRFQGGAEPLKADSHRLGSRPDRISLAACPVDRVYLCCFRVENHPLLVALRSNRMYKSTADLCPRCSSSGQGICCFGWREWPQEPVWWQTGDPVSNGIANQPVLLCKSLAM